MDWAIVLALGLAAGTVAGIVGFGTAIILLPALVIVFGPREAVPIMAITAILANLSRVGVWWREVDWKVCAAFGSDTWMILICASRRLFTVQITRWPAAGTKVRPFGIGEPTLAYPAPAWARQPFSICQRAWWRSPWACFSC